MINKKKEEEATNNVANASETTDDESVSEQENTEESVEKESNEEITSDYLKGSEESEGESEEPENIDYKKRYGDSTREYQTLKKEADNLTLAISNLEKLAKANPKIVAEIEAAQRLAGETGSSSVLVQQQVDEALKPVKKIAQDLQDKDRRAKVKVLAAFESRNPDLFSPKTTKEEKKAIRQRIGKVANVLVESGMTFKQAVERAYLTVNPKAAVQKGRDEAYIDRFGEDRAGFSKQVSSEGKQTKKTQYSKRELEIADKLDSTGKVRKAMLNE